MASASQIEKAINDLLHDPLHLERLGLLRRGGLDILPLLSEALSRDLPFESVERLESVLKAILFDYFSGEVTGEGARKIVRFQKATGFLLKFKPYTIKASSPLGYSIFFHTPGKGFSFQRHVKHKTEIFHILHVYEGGYIFVCDYPTWKEKYDRDSFSAWLSGEPNKSYEQCCFYPQPGDVLSIDRLNIVHSVVGCILEEFATTSLDMVDRLHDQNKRDWIPAEFTRSFAYDRLRVLDPPAQYRKVSLSQGRFEIKAIDSEKISGVRSTPIADHVFSASHLVTDPSKSTDLYFEPLRATSVFVFGGRGHLVIGNETEVRAYSPPVVELQKGDILTVPNKVYFRFVSSGDTPFSLSKFAIPFDLAFKNP
jgi:mannose-6-phosphate isomerase-like protein (cupin superfamily)